MKPGVIALFVGAAVVGGYVYYTNMEASKAAVDQEAGVPAEDMTGQDSSAVETNVLEQAVEVVEDAAEAVVEATSDAVETVGEAAVEAVEATTEMSSEAAEAATTVTTEVNEVVEGVADTPTEVTEGAAEVSEQPDTAMPSASDATGEATSEAVEAAESVAATVMAGNPVLFTADGFDLDKVVDLISGSSLDEATKLALATAVTQAKDNPELLNAALGQVKSALGL